MSRPHLEFSRGTLLLTRISASMMNRVFGPGYWVWDSRSDAWRCDAINYHGIIDQAKDARCAIEDTVPRWKTIQWPKPELNPLRPEQNKAASAWWRAGRRGVIVMPTGTGKTEVALAIMHKTAVSTLIVSPVRDLMYQWHRRILNHLGYDAGIIGDNVFNVRPVSVTTYDSACIHMDKLGDRFGLLVFDECHHLPGEMRRDAARMSASLMRLGLSATIERSDGRHFDLEFLIGPVVYDMPLSAARGGALADYDVVRIPVHLSADEQVRYEELSQQVRFYVGERRESSPDFSWEDLCADADHDLEARRVMKAFHAKKAIEDRAEEKLRVLEDLFRLHVGGRIIVFAGSNAMARDVSRRFLIPCLLNHSRKKERLEILQGLQDGTYPAIVANQVLDEGVDLPEAKVAIVIGGTASTRQAKQRLGRILRKSGNEKAILYDIVCADTREELRSRQRRQTDAYQGTRHRQL